MLSRKLGQRFGGGRFGGGVEFKPVPFSIFPVPLQRPHVPKRDFPVPLQRWQVSVSMIMTP